MAERLFQSFAPLNEKDFLPFSVPIFGNLRSVDVLRSLYEVLCEFFLNKLRKYGGASSFKLLKTIVLDSMSIKSLIVFHPSFSINLLLGVSKLLFVTIHDFKINSKAHVEQKSCVLIGWFQSLDNVSMCDSTYVCSVLKFVTRMRFYIHRV